MVAVRVGDLPGPEAFLLIDGQPTALQDPFKKEQGIFISPPTANSRWTTRATAFSPPPPPRTKKKGGWTKGTLPRLSSEPSTPRAPEALYENGTPTCTDRAHTTHARTSE